MSTPITANSFKDFYTDTTGATGATGITHIYDVIDTGDLKKIVSAYVYCDSVDGDHDLQRTGDQQNPLILYCERHFNPHQNTKSSYINGRFVYFRHEYKGECKSQPGIRKNIEKYLRDNDKQYGKRLPLERISVPLEKSLQTLQQYLVNEYKVDGVLQDNGFGRVGSSVVETHRGGFADSDENKTTHSRMYKSYLTTTFDLGSRPQNNFIPLTIGEIVDYPNIGSKRVEYRSNSKTLGKDGLPVLRFYPNYFPNAFSVFIKGDELLSVEKFFEIITPYFQGNRNFTINESLYHDCETQLTILIGELDNLIRSTDSTITFTSKSIFLLHMFTQIDDYGKKIPTFSLQHEQVIADDVTMQLYGERKRSVVGCVDEMVGFKPKGIVFADDMPFEMKCCHTLYGKTCGDGVTIEAANMFSYIHKETTNVLSSDFCCNLRASYVTGFSTNQAQTKTAGTGLGFLSSRRNVEFFKSAAVSGGKSLGQIYAVNIANNYDEHQFNAEKMQELLEDGLDLKPSTYFLDYCVGKFIDKKIDELRGFLHECSIELIGKARSIEDEQTRGLNPNITQYHKDLFEKVGRFHFSTIKAEVDEYRSSFQKIITSFSGFYKIFTNIRFFSDSDISAENIEKGISYISSIEEKLKQCYGLEQEVIMNSQQVIMMTPPQGKNNQKKTVKNSSYQEIVFVFLSTFLSGIRDTSIDKYSNDVVNEIKDILEREFKIEGELLNENNTKKFYKELLDIYNNGIIDKIDPIHQIEPHNKLYPYKYELKQRINLLKFILRFQEFYGEKNSSSDRFLIVKPIISTSKLEVLNNKLKLVVDYKKLQSTYASPKKTPLRMDVDHSSQRSAITNTSVTCDDDVDDDDEDDVRIILPGVTEEEIEERNFFSITYFENYFNGLFSYFQSNSYMFKIGDDVNRQREELEKLIKTLRKKDFDLKTKKQEYQKREYQALQGEELEYEVLQLEVLQLEVQQLEKQVRQLKGKASELELQIQELEELQQSRGLADWFSELFFPKKRKVQEGDVSPEDEPVPQSGEPIIYGEKTGKFIAVTNDRKFLIMLDGDHDQIKVNPEDVSFTLKAGSRTNLHKKTKKVTRRKNKKSPKRKTIKKRKMPKRKNKTRRNK